MGVTKGTSKVLWTLKEAASTQPKGVPKPRVHEGA